MVTLEDIKNRPINEKLVKKMEDSMAFNERNIEVIRYRMEHECLHLPLIRQWYDMIRSGEKKEEYRKITPYYLVRLFDFEKFRTTFFPTYTKQSFAELFCEPENRKWLKAAIEGGNFVPRHSKVHFTMGYPRKDDTERHMNMDIVGITIGEPNPGWCPKESENEEFFRIRVA